jgi:Flp pilus assembly protein TadG
MRTRPASNSNSKELLKNPTSALGADPQRSRRVPRGQTLIMFVLFMFVLILFVGLGVDLGFAYITRARLSKAVDSACLMGLRNISRGNGVARNIAESAFNANYRKSGQEDASVTPNVVIGSVNNNITIDVTATTHINTFFIRVMPALFPGGDSWQTLPVASTAQAVRPNLIMSLVLDRSGSMAVNNGASALPGAVAGFIDRFDDDHDRVSMSSFSSGSTIDVTMRQPFRQDIKNAANALVANGWTASERGLTNGLAQQQGVVAMSGEKVVRVLVFFTDGMANTWYNSFNCGARDVSPDGDLWDPVTGNHASSGCTVPGNLPSINPTTGQITANAVDSNDCEDMHIEAQNRAERIAWLARNQGITVYSIGMGSPGASGECGGAFPVLNPDFLKNVANTPDSDTFNSLQPQGDYAIAADASQLVGVFQQIADKILARLTK